MLTLATRPRLAAKARLRWDRKAERFMLLYPERGLVLNPTAADVVRLCTGELTVGAIVEQLTGGMMLGNRVVEGARGADRRHCHHQPLPVRPGHGADVRDDEVTLGRARRQEHERQR